jgi:putative sugar O-methyltransferase
MAFGRHMIGKFSGKISQVAEFVGLNGNRSLSDDGRYVAFVRSALRDPKIFAEFKRHPDYRAILEHVSEEYGRKYLDLIVRNDAGLLGKMEQFKKNDLLGSPFLAHYPETGEISPSTLRYVYVASELRRLFGSSLGGKIAEIGIGYGGQFLVNDKVFACGEVHLFDLQPVLELASRCLESHVLSGSYRMTTLNQHPGDQDYDLVISNYAFSELPSELQLAYVRKILVRSKRGYLTMNSGRVGNPFMGDHLSLESLRKALPDFEVLEELPATPFNNYVIVWGHRPVSGAKA